MNTRQAASHELSRRHQSGLSAIYSSAAAQHAAAGARRRGRGLLWDGWMMDARRMREAHITPADDMGGRRPQTQPPPHTSQDGATHQLQTRVDYNQRRPNNLHSRNSARASPAPPLPSGGRWSGRRQRRRGRAAGGGAGRRAASTCHMFTTHSDFCDRRDWRRLDAAPPTSHNRSSDR
jgi:hypothetical protein